MSPLRIGLVGSALLAGPPLYSLVETGVLTSGAALGRGAIVAFAATAGALYVQGLIHGYEAEYDALQRIQGQDAEAARAIAELAAQSRPEPPPGQPPA